MCCLLHCINQFCVNNFDILPLQQVQSQNIHVGDIVRVKRDESFPCDLVLISTSNNEGKCYITTANLDGETNLKVLFYRSFVYIGRIIYTEIYLQCFRHITVPRRQEI